MQRLKYAPSNIATFIMVKMTEEMKLFLRKVMDHDLMVEEIYLSEVWDRICENNYFGGIEDAEENE